MEIPDNRTVPQKAVDEINEILEKYDLAAMVIVQDKTDAAFVRRIDPTWSCAWMEPAENGSYTVRIRSKLAEYGGDKERQKSEIEATVGMFLSFGNWCHETEENMVKVTAMLAAHFPDILHKETWKKGRW